MKRCSICKLFKEPSKFRKNKNKKDGLECRCKSCAVMDHKIHREERIRYYELHRTEKIKSSADYYKTHKKDMTEYKRNYREANKINSRISNRKQHIMYTYGITLEEYNQLFLEQKGKCAICGRHQSELKRTMSIDHDHETGKIRGLLCQKCNVGIGSLNDDIDLLNKGIQYLSQNMSGTNR
jgi:prolyl oligopeptidase PreP (S9A serine peptidase family)